MVSKISKFELKERIYRRRYVFPNLVTMANIFCGFLAIIYATSDRYPQAVCAVLLAILCDGIDGRVARRLNATSRFGLELDSFADLISFGIAPAIMMYRWCFQVIADEFGVLVCFIYVIAAVLRLARFNISEENLTSFQGLPSPAAAASTAALVYSQLSLAPSYWLVIPNSFLLIMISFLMISNLKFMSVKTLKLNSMRAPLVVLLGLVIATLWYLPKVGFLTVAFIYLASGLASRANFMKKVQAFSQRSTVNKL